MARVTVEDCIDKVTNRFELVLLAAQRARAIGTGAALTVDRDNDKNTVVSLREIADETISLDALQEELIKNHQKIIEYMDGEEEWASLSDKDRLTDEQLENAGMHATDAATEEAAAAATEEEKS